MSDYYETEPDLYDEEAFDGWKIDPDGSARCVCGHVKSEHGGEGQTARFRWCHHHDTESNGFEKYLLRCPCKSFQHA